MTKDKVLQRREQLAADLAAGAEQLVRLQALQHTRDGAIQDCDHWLLVLGAEEERALGEAEADGQRAKVLEFSMTTGLDEAERVAAREALAALDTGNDVDHLAGDDQKEVRAS